MIILFRSTNQLAIWNVQDGSCKSIASLHGARIRAWVTWWWNWLLWSKISFGHTNRLSCSHVFFDGYRWWEGRLGSTDWMGIKVYCKVLVVVATSRISFSCHKTFEVDRSTSICFSCSSCCSSNLLLSYNNFSPTVIEIFSYRSTIIWTKLLLLDSYQQHQVLCL